MNEQTRELTNRVLTIPHTSRMNPIQKQKRKYYPGKATTTTLQKLATKIENWVNYQIKPCQHRTL